LANGELRPFDASINGAEIDFDVSNVLCTIILRKWGCWKLEESPNDTPHYTVALRLLRDFYKHARVEADANETRVYERNKVVEDLRGLTQQEAGHPSMSQMSKWRI
jgi:hypothetical protein